MSINTRMSNLSLTSAAVSPSAFSNEDKIAQELQRAKKVLFGLEGEKINIREVLSLLKGKEDLAEALWMLGTCHEYGCPDPHLSDNNNNSPHEQDYKKAFQYYQQAYDNDPKNSLIGYSLAQCYVDWVVIRAPNEDETFTKQGNALFAKIIPDLRKKAGEGNALAQTYLGICYNCGWGVEEDEEEAIAWVLQGAQQECAIAHYFLGDCYSSLTFRKEHGIALAIEQYEKAAEQNHAGAYYELGGIYLGELGGKPNFQKAFEYFRLAAAQGHKDAQEKLRFLSQPLTRATDKAPNKRLYA